MHPQAETVLIILTLIQYWSFSLRPAQASYTLAEQSRFVALHNRLRQTAYPRAKAMNFIIWSFGLADLTANFSKHCNPSFNINSRLFQNFDFNTYKGPIDTASPENVTLHWYAEKSHFKIIQGNWIAKPGCSTGNFTNMMRDSIMSMGCGFHDCGNRTDRMVVCVYFRYRSAAQVQIYEFGPSCSGCPLDFFCLDGLCVAYFSIARAELPGLGFVGKGECKINCQNCASRTAEYFVSRSVNKTFRCACNCDSSTSGKYCEVGSSVKACKQCDHSTPACQNGGIKYVAFVRPATVQCACFCPPEFVGNQCEIGSDLQINSVKLTFNSINWFISGSLMVLPPVSEAQFSMEIWTETFRSAVATAITNYCRKKNNYNFCCTGREYSPEVAAASFVGPSDVNYLKSTVGNLIGGELQLLLYISVPKTSTMCTVGKLLIPKRKLLIQRDPVQMFVRPKVIESAISKSMAAISKALPSGVIIKAIENVQYRSDLGAAYGPIWTDDYNRSTVTEIDYSNITTCIVEHRNSTEESGTDPFASVARFHAAMTILSLLLMMFCSVE